MIKEPHEHEGANEVLCKILGIEKILYGHDCYLSGCIECFGGGQFKDWPRLWQTDQAIKYLLPPLQRSCAIQFIHFPDREQKPFEMFFSNNWRPEGPSMDSIIRGIDLGECLFLTALNMTSRNWRPRL